MKNMMLFILFSLSSLSSFAWRETGHYSVCEIAYRTASTNTKQILDRIFEGNPFAVNCTWPDHVRKTEEYGHTYNWHFINLNPGENYFENISARGDALQAIVNLQDDLIEVRRDILNRRKPISGEKARLVREKLKFLGHFIGDIHQPLHVGHKTDLGGNKISVKWEGIAKKNYKDFKMVKGAHLHAEDRERDVNLHKVLDEHFFDKLLKELEIELGETGTGYEAYSDLLLEGKIVTFNQESFPEWTSASPEDWLNESLAERVVLYEVTAGDELSQGYFQKHKDLINLKVLKAGIRLGKILDNIFDKDYSLNSNEVSLRRKIQRALAK